MGKGDRKTFRGKTYRGSYGNTRAHAAPAVAGGKPTVVKPATRKPAVVKSAAPKAAAAKPAAAKSTTAVKKPAAKKKPD